MSFVLEIKHLQLISTHTLKQLLKEALFYKTTIPKR